MNGTKKTFRTMLDDECSRFRHACGHLFILKKIGAFRFKQIVHRKTNNKFSFLCAESKNCEIYSANLSWLKPLQNVAGINHCRLHISPGTLNTQLHAMFTGHYFRNINIRIYICIYTVFTSTRPISN